MFACLDDDRVPLRGPSLPEEKSPVLSALESCIRSLNGLPPVEAKGQISPSSYLGGAHSAQSPPQSSAAPALAAALSASLAGSHLPEDTVNPDDFVAPAVFLGGSCDPTTWRKDKAIPQLQAADVSFFNPQTDSWSTAFVALENRAKEQAHVLLFVIDAQTRAIASMLEAAELIARGRVLVLCVQSISDGASIDGDVVTGRQLKDLNRARFFLLDIARRSPGTCHICETVDAAIAAVAKLGKLAAAAEAEAEELSSSRRGAIDRALGVSTAPLPAAAARTDDGATAIAPASSSLSSLPSPSSAASSFCPPPVLVTDVSGPGSLSVGSEGGEIAGASPAAGAGGSQTPCKPAAGRSSPVSSLPATPSVGSSGRVGSTRGPSGPTAGPLTPVFGRKPSIPNVARAASNSSPSAAAAGQSPLGSSRSSGGAGALGVAVGAGAGAGARAGAGSATSGTPGTGTGRYPSMGSPSRAPSYNVDERVRMHRASEEGNVTPSAATPATPGSSNSGIGAALAASSPFKATKGGVTTPGADVATVSAIGQASARLPGSSSASPINGARSSLSGARR